MAIGETYKKIIARTIEDGDCIVFQMKTKIDRPIISVVENGKNVKYQARRIAYLQKHKKIPHGYRVVATCGTMLCVNPSHLKAMSPKEFSANANYSKAMRTNAAFKRKSTNLTQILDMEKANQIRISEKPKKELAKEYGVAIKTIEDVLNYKTWNRNNMFSQLIR